MIATYSLENSFYPENVAVTVPAVDGRVQAKLFEACGFETSGFGTSEFETSEFETNGFEALEQLTSRLRRSSTEVSDDLALDPANETGSTETGPMDKWQGSPWERNPVAEPIGRDELSKCHQMRCECLQEKNLFDLVEHIVRLRESCEANAAELGRCGALQASVGPILIYVADYQEAIEIDRCLESVKFRTHLASPFSNWTSILGKLGTGQVDVVISTTTEIPYADQVPWQAIYLPTAIHLAMLTTPALDWLGNFWFANHGHENPPQLFIRRAKGALIGSL